MMIPQEKEIFYLFSLEYSKNKKSYVQVYLYLHY